MKKNLNICNKIVEFKVKNFEHLRLNTRVNKDKNSQHLHQQKIICRKKSSPGGMAGWVGVKAGLRIAYSNLKGMSFKKCTP